MRKNQKAVFMPLSAIESLAQLNEFLNFIKRSGDNLSAGKNPIKIWAMLPINPSSTRSPFRGYGFGVYMAPRLQKELLGYLPIEKIATWRKQIKRSEADWLKNLAEIHGERSAEYEVMQMVAFRVLVHIAKQNGVKLYADLPFYICGESFYVETHKNLFVTDEYGKCNALSGVVSDDIFGAQFWGQPIYDWENHQKLILKFFARRLKHLKKIGFAGVRIDHANGFYRYGRFENADDKGKMMTGPGDVAVKYLVKEAKKIGINLWWEVIAKNNKPLKSQLLKLKQPHIYDIATHLTNPNSFIVDTSANTVFYSSTHDSWSLRGTIERTPPGRLEKLARMFDLPLDMVKNREIFSRELVKKFYNMNDLYCVVLPIWDIRNEDVRVNTPGTPDDENWEYKFK
jgi:4-alpha-glucanotransferase